MNNTQQLLQLSNINCELLGIIDSLQKQLIKRDVIISNQKDRIIELTDKRDLYKENCKFWKQKNDKLCSDITQMLKKTYL